MVDADDESVELPDPRRANIQLDSGVKEKILMFMIDGNWENKS